MKINALLLILALSASATQAQDLSQQFPVKGASSSFKKAPGSGKKPKGPAQAAVAAKSAFPILKASDPSLKTAISATNLAGAQKSVGKNVVVVGVVTAVFAPKSGSITLLNFAKDYKKAVVGAVKSQDFAKFPNLMLLKGKKVALRGPMISYKGKPEVELTKAGSILLVK